MSDPSPIQQVEFSAPSVIAYLLLVYYARENQLPLGKLQPPKTEYSLSRNTLTLSIPKESLISVMNARGAQLEIFPNKNTGYFDVKLQNLTLGDVSRWDLEDFEQQAKEETRKQLRMIDMLLSRDD